MCEINVKTSIGFVSKNLEPAEKMFIGGGQDEFSQPNIGCHKDATSIISLVSANQKFSANFV